MPVRARKTSKAEECAFFKAFWDEVWRKHANPNDGRGAARDEFYRHIEIYGADPKDIVDGARAYINLKQGNQKVGYDGNLIQQHASSWLSKRQYEDGADEWRDYQSRLQQSRERAENVVQIKPVLPANHFLNRYREG